MTMDFYQIIRGTAFLLTSAIGILGNALLLAFFAHLAYHQHGLMTSELILLSLTSVNLVMALTRGLPNCLFIFGLPSALSDTYCRLLVYVSRLSHDMSICLTCILSCFQCAALLSTKVTCMHVKTQMQIYIGTIIVLILIVNATVCLSPLLYTISGTNMTDLDYAYRVSYCIVVFPGKVSLLSQTLILFARDLVFVAGMILASYFILHTLYKHGDQMKSIRSSKRSESISAEARASKMVSTLAVLYVLIFGIDSSIWFYQTMSSKTIVTAISDVRFFLSVCYASFFPFILLFFDPKVMRTIQHFSQEHAQTVEDIRVIGKIH